MRNGILASMLLLTAHAVALGQAPMSLPAAPAQPGGAVPSAPFSVTNNAASASPLLTNQDCQPCPCESCGLRYWGSAEYLRWWVKNGPVSTPLVTTGDPASPTAGQFNDPSTRVLFGNHSTDYGAFSGGRLVLGGWLNDERTVGIEGSGFLLEQKVVRFSTASDPTGVPVLALPTLNPNGTNNAYYVASPGVQAGPFAGSVNVSSASRLWGADLSGVFNVRRGENYSVDLLAGFRYLDLQEDLQLKVASFGLGFDSNNLGNDYFNTRNHFYGGQLGARFGYETGRLSLNLTGQVALGATDQVTNINGSTVIFGTAVPAPGAVPGFVYSQPTNIGQFHHSDFSVVPQAQVKLGYDLLRQVRLTVGYDFMYWTNVARPGDQIDRVVNVSQTPPLGFGGAGQLTGPARPMPLTNHSDFFAHGVSFGMEFRW